MLHYKCSTHFYGRFLTVSLYGGVSLNCHNNSQLKSDLKDLFKTAQAAPEKIENTECQCRLNEKNEDVCIAAAMMRSVWGGGAGGAFLRPWLYYMSKISRYNSYQLDFFPGGGGGGPHEHWKFWENFSVFNFDGFEFDAGFVREKFSFFLREFFFSGF